jgi:hypothetical protein
MAQKQFKPERRAERLFKRLQMGVRLQKNDGTSQPKELWLAKDTSKGTSVIKDGELHFEWRRRKKPDGERYKYYKNYKSTTPDQRFDSRDFIEIKGDIIEGNDWRELGLHSFNDQIRLSLLRIKAGVISCPIINFCGLKHEVQSKVVECLGKQKAGDGRRYLRFDELVRAVPTPSCNLEWTQLVHGNLTLPIKVLAGTKDRQEGRYFVLDDEVMKQWEKLAP